MSTQHVIAHVAKVGDREVFLFAFCEGCHSFFPDARGQHLVHACRKVGGLVPLETKLAYLEAAPR